MDTINKSTIDSNPQTQTTTRDENMWAMFCHLSSFAIFLIPSFGNIIGPLIIWVIKKDEFPLVNDQGKESINFQITMTIYFFVSILLSIVVIGIPIMIAILFFVPIVTIIAAIRASEGISYRYPLTIRFINWNRLLMVYFICLFLEKQPLSSATFYAMDSTEIAARTSLYSLFKMKLGDKWIRVYQDIDADVGTRW